MMYIKAIVKRIIHPSVLVEYRRNIYEFFGNDRYSRPALNDLDQKLRPYLDFSDGFFVELGANDGYTQSNTYYLEKMKGWRGILIEPIPQLYEQAAKRRSRSRVFNYACVSSEFEEDYVDMTFVNLMSFVKGAPSTPDTEQAHIRRGMETQPRITPHDLKVKARTLTSILDECAVTHIDFLSLDVEGYELDVLHGLDFQQYAPVYMLIESRNKDALDALLCEYYSEVEQLTEKDYLYKRRET